MWQAITLVFKLNSLVVIENDIGCLATGQLYQMRNVILKS